ncbi:MAG: sugar phosphate isomerase/epimerase [Candidatus Omnitrophota bacterium]
MKREEMLTRRGFLSASGAAAFAVGLPKGNAHGEEASAPKDRFCGLKVGIASYSTREFTLDQTIEMAKRLDVRYLTLKDFHLKMDTTAEERNEAARKIKDAGLVLMGGGVIYMKNDEKQVRNAFEYARDAGMPVIVGAPDIDALPLVEKMVNEFDIKVAIHNHGPGDNKYPSPLDAYRCALPYDKRIGLCIDIGHSVRWGDNEIEVIRAVKDRLYDFHIKDVSARAKEGKMIEIGRGVIDIPGVLKTLMEIGFTGHVALEYEKESKDPLPGMAESFGYLRGVLAVL